MASVGASRCFEICSKAPPPSWPYCRPNTRPLLPISASWPSPRRHHRRPRPGTTVSPELPCGCDLCGPSTQYSPSPGSEPSVLPRASCSTSTSSSSTAPWHQALSGSLWHRFPRGAVPNRTGMNEARTRSETLPFVRFPYSGAASRRTRWASSVSAPSRPVCRKGRRLTALIAEMLSECFPDRTSRRF